MARIQRCIKDGCEVYVNGDWVKITKDCDFENNCILGKISEIGIKKITIVTTPWFKNEQYGYHQEAKILKINDIFKIERIEKMFD